MPPKKSRLHTNKKHKQKLAAALSDKKAGIAIWTSIDEYARSLGFVESSVQEIQEKTYLFDKASDNTARIHLRRITDSTMMITMSVNGTTISTLPQYPAITQFTSVDNHPYLQLLATSKLCSGNPDEKFRSLDAKSPVHHKECHVVTSNTTRCPPCDRQRSTLRSQLARHVDRDFEKRTDVSSHTPLTSLSRDELIQRARNLTRERSALKIKYDTLVDKSMCNHAVTISSPLNDTFKQVQATSTAGIHKLFPEGTLQRILWDQQVKNANAKSSKGYRWHPMVIRWCLKLRQLSSSTYRHVADTGFLTLPSQRTLDAVINSYDFRSSISADCLDIIERKLGDEKDVMLLCDEMKLKDGVVFAKNSGELMGFTKMGDLNEELRSLTGEIDKRIATHALVYMIQSTMAKVTYSAAVYASCGGATGQEMYHTLWDVVGAFEARGIPVRGLICDGASSNRRVMQLCKDGDNEFEYYCQNRFADRRFYFISDVPHLLKTTRNCWEMSGGHKNTRNLVLHSKPIQWGHVLALYDEVMKTAGTTKLHKLTNDHVHLSSYGRMRVCLAAQVLSGSVASGLEGLDTQRGTEQYSSTAEFVRKFDKAFDILNVRYHNEGYHQLRDSKLPFYSLDDPRFQWLHTEFLGWLTAWKAEVDAQPNLSATERAACQLSLATLQGWRLTIHSFCDLTKELLTQGYRYVLSERLVCQDSLEEYFASLRQAGGSCLNPTIGKVASYNKVNVITKHLTLSNKRSNCRGSSSKNITITDSPVKKVPQ